MKLTTAELEKRVHAVFEARRQCVTHENHPRRERIGQWQPQSLCGHWRFRRRASRPPADHPADRGRRAQHDALALVVTFDKHPNAVVAPERVPPQIFSRSQKLRAIESLGADALLEIPFDKAFSEKSGEVFIRELAHGLGKIHSICVGADFVFGHKRSGNVELLKKLGAELFFQVHGLAAVALDGQVVSSTRIREMIRAGDFDAASQMLGRPYAICGRVVEGDRIGRQLGFPTANLDAAGLILPPNGVYAASTKLQGTILSRRAEHRHASDGGGGAAAVARGGAPAGFQRRPLRARSWRWNWGQNCGRNGVLVHWRNCASKLRGTWRRCGRRADFAPEISIFNRRHGCF